MDQNQNQNTNTNVGSVSDGTDKPGSLDYNTTQAPSDSEALSLDPSSFEPSDEEIRAAKHTNGVVRLLKRADVLLVLLLVVGMVGLIIANVRHKAHNSGVANIASQYNTVKLPLGGFVTNEQGVNFGNSSVLINGSLKLNDGLVVSPSVQPNAPTAGQLYYDQNTNEMAYYNGTSFVPLTAQSTVVQSIGGASGAVTLGGGLSVVGNQLANGGVLSFGGQTGSITVGNGLKMNGNTLQSAGVLSLAAGTSNLQVTDDGSGNLTISNVGAGSGTVSSPGGTAGQLAVFNGAQAIGDSIVSQSGSTVTVTGNLNVSGVLNITSPLGVASGGTGANTFAANGVLVGNGASAISSVTAASPGLCFVSTAGAPAFASCSGGSTVTSLDSLSGALTIANSTGVGTVVTIDDATTASKGIASFNATNFSVVAGVVNTVQNISSASTPTFAGVNTNAITPSGSLTIGAGGQSFTLQGNAASTIISAGGGGTTTLGFTGTPTGAVNYQFDRSAAPSTYIVCTTAGNCVGVGGSISGSGTSGTLPVFNGGQTITDSLVSQSGSTVTGNGNLNLTVGHQYQINSTQISSANLSNDANLAKLNATQTFTGATNTFQNGSDSALAFSIQNAAAKQVLSVNTLTGQAVLGQSSTLDGRLVFKNATNANAGTLQTAALGQDTTYTLPDPGAASATICLSSGNCSGAATTLQSAYTNSTNPEIVLDAVRGALTVRDNAAPLGANLFEVQNNTGSTTYLAVTSAGATVSGTTTSSGNINSSGGALQTNGVTRVDNSGNLSNIGSLALSGSISGGTTYTGSGDINTTGGALQTNSITRVDNSGNLTNIAAITASGNATIQGGSVTLGTAVQAGSLIISDGSSNTGTLQTAALGQNTVYTLPDPGAASATICLSSGNCSGAATTLQSAYTNSTNPEIVLDAVRGALTIRDNAAPLGANLLEVQDNAGSTTYLAVTSAGASVTGTIASTGNINTTGGALQTNSVSRVDNSGNLVNIGNLTGSGAVTIASSGAGNNVIIDGANQFVVQDVATFNAASTFNSSVSLALANTQNLSLTNTVTGTNAVNLISAVLTNNTTSGTQQVALLQNASGSGATEALLHLDNADAAHAVASGLQITTAAGGITNALDVSDPNIVTALLFGANDITGTNFSVTGGNGNFLSAGSGTIQGGTIALGTAAQGGSLVLSDGSSNTGTLQTASLGQNTVYTLPDPGGATATICLTTGNCAGTGGGVTGSGTADHLAKFNGTGSVIADSTLTDNGTTVSTTGNLVIQGGTATIGIASSQTGSLALANSGSAFLATINSAALGQATAYTLPDPGGATATFCLSSGNCSGSGSSATLQAAYDAGNTITTSTGRNIAITLAHGGTDASLTVTAAAGSTGFTTFGLADGANPTPAAQLVLVKNNDTNQVLAAGIAVQSAAGGITTAFDASGANITNALSIGGNAIAGTNFAVSSGGAVTAVGVNSGVGLLQGTGGLTLTGTASVNTTGSANTSIGNATGSLTLTSSGLNATAGGAVSGVSTLATSGIITAGGVGAADTSTFLCRNSSNQIATCSTTGSGVAFIQGGNSFGVAGDLGTNDGQPLNFRTSGTTKLTLSTGGDLTYAAGSGGFDQSNSTGTFKTGSGNVTLNGDTTVTGGKNLSLASGAGTFSQTYTSAAASNAQNIAISNTNTGAGISMQGINLTPTNTAVASSGTNTLNVINLAAGGALGGSDQTNGINFASATGYTNFIKTPTAVLTSGGAFTGLTGVSLASGNVTTPGNISTTGSGNITSAGTVTVGSFAAASSTAVCSNAGVLSTCNANPSGVTLQQAYAAGNTISTTGNDIGFTLNSSQNFTVTTAFGGTGASVFSLADGSNPTPPAQLVLVRNNDVNQAVSKGIAITSAAGGITTALDASGTNITNALAIGANAISGTNFSVTGAGAVTAVGVNSGSGLLQGAAGLTVTGAVSINTTGASNTSIGNATGTLALTSAALNVTTGGAVTGVTTLATSGIITDGALGAADTATALCRNSSNQIATCTTGVGAAFIQGGNSFNAAGDLGTNDAFALNIRTNNATRLTVSTTGDLTWAASSTGGFDQSNSTGTFKTGSGNVTLGGNTTVSGTKTFTVTSGLTSLTSNTSGDALNVSNSSSTGNIAVFSDGATAVATWANGGAVQFRNQTDSAAAFQVQDTGTASLLTVNTLTRTGGVSGNLIKVGDSTGTDTATTILQLDGTTADPTTNLASLNGGMFYNTTTNKVSLIENGQVKVICNTTDLGCGTGTVTLQTAYGNGTSSATTPEIKLDSTRGALDIQDADTTIAGSLFNVRASAAGALGAQLFSVGSTGAIVQSGSTTTDAYTMNSTNAAGTQTNGLLFNRNGAGTTTNGINVTNTAGTLTNGIAFTGTIGTDINRGSGILTLQGTGGITATGAGTTTVSLDTGGAGTVSLGTANAVTLDIGSAAPAAARTTTIAGGNAGFVDTVNIGTGNGTVAGAKTIHIGDGAPSGSGTNLITIGSIAATANSTIVQGGNGATAIQLLAAASGTITIGTTTAGTANTVNINNATNAGAIDMGSGMTTGTIDIGGASQTGAIGLGESTVTQTINIGNAQTATGQTLSVNMATSATGTGKAVVLIGNTNGASSLTLQSGTGNTSLLTTGNVTIGTSDTTGTLLVLDTKTGSGDPTGVDGGMYYNSNLGEFRCYEGDTATSGYWRNCMQNARTGWIYQNEMTTKAADGTISFTQSGTGASNDGSAFPSTALHPGIMEQTTGTTAAGFSDIGSADANGQSILLGGGDTWRFETEVQLVTLSNGTDTYVYRAGFNDSPTGNGDATDGCYFRYTDAVNGGKWQGRCDSGGTGNNSVCDTTITATAGAWVRLTVVVNAAGTSTDFQVNGVSKCQVTTNIPTGTGHTTTFMDTFSKTVGTTSLSALVDYIELQAQFGSSR